MLKWLGEKDPRKLEELFRAAREAKLRYLGPKVYFRGLIEFSNHCVKDCYYCGIRKSNQDLKRFSMTEAEILECAKVAQEMNYGSIVLQSGERQDEVFVRFIEDILRKIKAESSGKLGITLSLGEQTEETYERWFKAGAHRYLLRIETSDPAHYKRLHPADHSFETRRECLRALRRTGYQVGTGVMIGLPFQTYKNLVDDILFFKSEDVDMIGMGPYVSHEDAPLSKQIIATPTPGVGKGRRPIRHPVSGRGLYDPAENFRLGLVMIALARLFLKDVNIAAATALQTIDSQGREKGILAGANIIMPNITPTDYRKLYQLYDNKPCLDENARQCRNCLEMRVRHTSGEEIGYGEWGDSVHFLRKRKASAR
jgi:biotin synthase